jgi:glycosyltransferase involved in cell wall biosynthesis
MASSGMQVFLLRLQGESGILQGLPQGVKEVRWHDSPERAQKGVFSKVKDLQRIIEEIQPELIHAGPLTDCGLLAAGSGFQPLVSMSWGSDILATENWDFRKKKILHRTLKQSTVLIGDCDAVKNKAITMGFVPDRIVTFPWGVDLHQFSPGKSDSFRKKLGIDRKFVILSLRSWEPIYGVDLAVKAFIIAAKKNSNLFLLLGGIGTLEQKIRAMVERSGVKGQIQFLGQIPQRELPEIYRASNLYLSASHSDGSSVSLLESIACGKPVLVSDIPGNREWVSEGQNGWLFRDGNVKEIADLLARISGEKVLLKKIGSNNHRLAAEKADWTKNSMGLLRAYKMALKLKGPA